MNNRVISNHIFYFPFKWEIDFFKNSLFEAKVDLRNIVPKNESNWIRISEPLSDIEKDLLYNEQNYFYKFVHNVLYDTGNDDTLIKHYRRSEPIHNKNVSYTIRTADRDYILEVEDIILNFYSTGIGILAFYLENKNPHQAELIDIKRINQFGRRIMPPFIQDVDLRSEIAQYISIQGLSGNFQYLEDFNEYKQHKKAWQIASFILNILNDFSDNINYTPIVDDRMIVNCWYYNENMAEKIKNDYRTFLRSDDWYSYVFIDPGGPTCQNMALKEKLITEATNPRWEKEGNLYAITRYSIVSIGAGNFYHDVIRIHMKTIYARMLELVILQLTSILRFSEEVTLVSNLKEKSVSSLSLQISSLYKEYIRFVNQIYFRQVTAQDQGIELYNTMLNQFELSKQIKELDDEISELHHYASLIVDNKRQKNAEILNIIAAVFLPATLTSSIFGMNSVPDLNITFTTELIIIIIITFISVFLVLTLKKK